MTTRLETTLARAILRRHCTGLSMAELAVVLGMVAITSSLAAPGLHRIVQGQELRVAASDLYSAIQLARSQAIAACIVLRARPGTANVNAAFADPECGTLTLASTGAQGASGASGSSGASTRCWP